jgi:hypothetical protein
MRKWETILESAGAVAATIWIWTQRAWFAEKLMIGLWRAWCSAQQLFFRKKGIDMGTTNIFMAISILAMLGNVGGKAYEDGKLDEKDVMLITNVVMILPLAIKCNWGEALAEGKALDLTASEACMEHFKKEFDIPQDNTEFLIEDVISFVIDGASMIKRAVEIFKRKEPVQIA